MAKDFTHLHVHTDYSLLDGLNKIEDLFAKAQNDKMNSIAITDHGVLYGAGEFWKMSHDFHIKPIIGCEIYVSPKERGLREPVDGINYYHLVLLAKNLEGYKNLVKIVSTAQLEGMYYRPRADAETLKKYSEGLICTSACLAGPISRHIVRDEEPKAIEWLKFLKHTYGENFYLELQRNGYKHGERLTDKEFKVYDEETIKFLNQQIKVNKKLREYSEQYKIPLIATSDAHYLNKEDKDVQSVLFCIKDGTQLNDPNRREGYLDTYVKSPEEMYEHFSDDATPLINTMKIAEQIEEFSLKFERVQPKYLDLPKNQTAKEELRKQAYEGAMTRYGEITEELKKRIDYELMVIDEKGYNDYFLVVGDLMQYARRQGIVVGARGSAAGCVVSYCLDVTNIDPIKWELYFERFLNLERPSPPDIDMDFQDDRRDEVIDYAREKYGDKNVASICAVGRLKTKAAIRDVARVMGVDLKIADTLSKKVQVVFGKVFPIEKMMEVDPEFAEIVNGDPQLVRLKEIVTKVEGLARHMSRHAAGYLITPEPIDEYMALQVDSKYPDMYMTQLDGTWIDKLDYMKFDFLGLRTLTIIKNAINLIKERHNVTIDVNKLPEDDKKTFDLFGRGETIGVFQFESPPMQQHLRDLQPENLEDICFLAAAYRPGPMKFIPDYIKCKHGEAEPEYIIPELEPILNKTFGFPIYQEQLFAICRDLGGFSLGEGDVIRNALKKKQIAILNAKRPDFVKYFLENFDYGEEIALKVWDNLTPFSDYGFNKAHSASYAVVAYWCAYLKAHYPLEFMAALMHSDLENLDRIAIDIREAKRMGYQLRPPDINRSNVYFTTESIDSIRFGLGGIKGVGIKICEQIVEERDKNGPFKSLDDLVDRLTTNKLSKKVMENLAKSGALAKFGEVNAILEVIPMIFSKVRKSQHAAKIGQESLFAMATDANDGLIAETPLPNVEPASEKDILRWEKDLLNVYLSSHPLEEYEHAMLSNEITSLSKAKNMMEGKQIKSIVMFTSIKTTYTKKDSKPMALLQIEDLDTRVEGVMFPRSYAKHVEDLEENHPYLMTGSTNFRNDNLNIIVDSIQDASSFQGKSNKEILIDICSITDEENLKILRHTITSNPGKFTLRIKYGNPSSGKEIIKTINPTREVMSILNEYQ